jgi:SEC-C motif
LPRRDDARNAADLGWRSTAARRGTLARRANRCACDEVCQEIVCVSRGVLRRHSGARCDKIDSRSVDFAPAASSPESTQQVPGTRKLERACRLRRRGTVIRSRAGLRHRILQGRLTCESIAISKNSPAFSTTRKRRKSFPSETHVKRGPRVVHGDVELTEKLGRNDLCPCGSGRRFQSMLHEVRQLRRRKSQLLLLESRGRAAVLTAPSFRGR